MKQTTHNRCNHFHDDQIQGPWCDLRSGMPDWSLDCSDCEKNHNIPRCGTCMHFMCGSPNGMCMKVRGEAIFDKDGCVEDYVEHMKVREEQISCNFYEKEG